MNQQQLEAYIQQNLNGKYIMSSHLDNGRLTLYLGDTPDSAEVTGFFFTLKTEGENDHE